MRLSRRTLFSLLLSAPLFAAAKSAWSFQDGTASVQGKGSGVGGGADKENFAPKSPITSPFSLGPTDTLKVQLTTVDGKTAKRPHQAFLTFQEEKTGLEESFPLNVRDNGKGKIDITQKDLPIQLLTTNAPLRAAVILGSFGQSAPSNTYVFSVNIRRDPATPLQIPDPPVRYGKLPEIHHIFRDDPKSPPVVVSLMFTFAAFGTLPMLVGVWLILGANFNHLGDALNKAPVAHGMFFGSIIALEGIFFLYYTTWSLFQMLPAAAVVGLVAFVSGSRALTEVHERRLAGKR